MTVNPTSPDSDPAEAESGSDPEIENTEGLSPEAWKIVWKLFARTRDLDADQRAAFLDRERARLEPDIPSAPKIQEEVESLLLADEQGQDFLVERELHEDDVWDERWDSSHDELGSKSELKANPTLPGGYQLLTLIGRGGMSDVYLAKRVDASFEQQVAIKILRRGLDTPEMIDRFERERDLLLSLQHSAIVSLLDAGTTQDERPFLVLNYVEGVPLTTYCTEHRLSREEVLDLFIVLCRAVQYAHGKLVVHRDLKPSNVLVTSDGRLQLLDFGVAKLLEPGPNSDLTLAARAPMTRNRAAPEQREGKDITTATDVWALGVLLHELLVGELPGDLETKPTTDTTELPVDLRSIIKKCLRVDPQLRYVSAQHLAEDLGRFLRQEPVHARAPRLGYRAQRFFRRHLLSSSLGVLLALSLVVLTVASASQAVRLKAERDRADSESDKASATLDMLVSLLGEADPLTGEPKEEISVARLLQKAEEAAAAMVNEPLVQARVWRAVGQVMVERGDFAAAEPLLQRARDSYREHLGGQAPQTFGAELLLATIRHRKHGDMEGARTELRRLVEAIRPLEELEPRLAADAYRLLGALLPSDEGERLIQESIVIYRRLQEKRVLAAALSNLSMIRSMRGERSGAKQAGAESLALYLELEGPRNIMVLSMRSNLANQSDDPAHRLAVHREILRDRIAAMGPDHRHVGNSHRHVALAARELGQHEEAVDSLRQAERILSEGGSRMGLRVKLELARSLNHVDPVAARPLFDQLLAQLEEGRQKSLTLVGSAYNFAALDRWQEAEADALAVISKSDAAATLKAASEGIVARAAWAAGQASTADSAIERARLLVDSMDSTAAPMLAAEIDLVHAIVSFCAGDRRGGSGIEASSAALADWAWVQPADLARAHALLDGSLGCPRQREPP